MLSTFPGTTINTLEMEQCSGLSAGVSVSDIVILIFVCKESPPAICGPSRSTPVRKQWGPAYNAEEALLATGGPRASSVLG